MTSYFTLDAGLSFWCPRTSSALRSGISVGLLHVQAPQDATVSISSDLSPTSTHPSPPHTWKCGGKKIYQVSINDAWNTSNKSQCYSLKWSPADLEIGLPMLRLAVWLQQLALISSPAVQFSWAGDKPQMSTSRHPRKSRGWSPSTRKRCPLGLCCCKLPDYKSLPLIVSGPRCENLPGLQQKLAWRRILLRACPAVKTNWFNQGWCDVTPQPVSWKELNQQIMIIFAFLLFFVFVS